MKTQGLASEILTRIEQLRKLQLQPNEKSKLKRFEDEILLLLSS